MTRSPSKGVGVHRDARLLTFTKMGRHSFAYLPLRMMLRPRNHAAHARGCEVAVRTRPDVSKIELREYISQLYGVDVQQLNTANYAAKTVRRSDPVTRKQWSTQR